MNDPERNTGRTHRMVVSAMHRAAKGARVALLFGSAAEIDRVCQRYQLSRLDAVFGQGRLYLLHANFCNRLHGMRFDEYDIDHAVGALDPATLSALRHAVTPKEPPPMKPFDPTKPVQTRDGNPARIICTDRKDVDYPIVALVTTDGGYECLNLFTAEGKYTCIGGSTPADLVNIPERSSKFYNVYPRGEVSAEYFSRESADEGQMSDGSRVGVLEYVYEDDELVDVIFSKVGKQSNAAA